MLNFMLNLMLDSKRTSGTGRIAQSALLSLLLLGGCASGPSQSDRPVDPSSVRVSGSVNRDFARSVEHLQAEEYSEAIVLLNEVIASEQRLPAPYINLGIAYFRLGNEKNAEESLLHALKVAPLNPVATNELAVLYRTQGRFDEARVAYTKALAEHPDHLPLIKNYGILCDLYLQDVNCALAQFERYLNYVPQDPDVSIWVADLKRRARM